MKALGSVLLALLVLACGAPSGAASPTPILTAAGVMPGVTGMVTEGPVCPVEHIPPDPSCAPRPVAGADIEAVDGAGRAVARATTTADGSYLLTVGETGTFKITGLPVAGLMRVPATVIVTLAFPGATQRVDLEYDTGLR